MCEGREDILSPGVDLPPQISRITKTKKTWRGCVPGLNILSNKSCLLISKGLLCCLAFAGLQWFAVDQTGRTLTNG